MTPSGKPIYGSEKWAIIVFALPLVAGGIHARPAPSISLSGEIDTRSQRQVIQTLAIRTESHLRELIQGGCELSEMSH